jgi:hypothetical protein
MKTPDSVRRCAVTALALLFVLPLAGCGGSDESAAPPPAPPPPALPPLAAASSLDDNRQIGDLFWPDGDTATGAQGQVVEGLSCGATVTTYHVHAHLSIFLDGRALAIPANIGIIAATATQAACTYFVHTHDRSGKVHLEGPAPATFTLGQFSAIWGQPLSSDNVAGLTGRPVAIYISDNGGAVTQYTGDPAAIELTSHREITIQVGAPIAQVPNYTWTGS